MREDSGTRSSPASPAAQASSTAPDLDATGSGRPLPSDRGELPDQSGQGRESQEREAAWRRGRQQESGPDAVGETGATPAADRELMREAFTALADNVRDYAIFLMDPDGIIRYWGEGAHLMKRWTRAQAVGAHLRFLYIDGGSEDGTAEGHLVDAAEHGEAVSEGRRVRADGTTFWAHVTLTTLRSENGTLLGYAKVTRDVSDRQEAASALSQVEREEALQSARAERRALAAEVEVLKEELAVLRDELRARDR